MEPVRLGVIGAGVIGRMHLRVAADSELLTPVAVADVRETVAQDLAAQHDVARAYSSAEALLADPEIEAVVLALPTAGRAELALAALSAGKHVLVEKPIALNAGEVRRMIAARGDLIAGCCSSRMRGLPSAGVAAALIAEGALGQLRVVRCRALKGAGDYDNRRVIELLLGASYAGYLSGEWIDWEPYAVHLPRELAAMQGLEQAAAGAAR